jgi:hypothetical protein
LAAGEKRQARDSKKTRRRLIRRKLSTNQEIVLNITPRFANFPPPLLQKKITASGVYKLLAG